MARPQFSAPLPAPQQDGRTKKVFISWSGQRSRKIAEVLRDWIPTVLPLDAWISTEDIRKGSRWSHTLASELQSTELGILVVLPENRYSLWLNFEAGAISKWVDHAKVAPLLFELLPSDLAGEPLSQFQATIFKKDDVLKLLKSMGEALEGELSQPKLERALDFTWPGLQERVRAALKSAPRGPHRNSPEPKSHAELDQALLSVLELIGLSEDNLMTDSEVAEALNIKRAKAEMFLVQLTTEGLLEQHHVAMVGECFSVTPTGVAYLHGHGLI